MSDTARKKRARRAALLMLATSDMHQAAAAAEALANGEQRYPLVRALETALAVSYARPFLPSNTIGHLSPKKYAPSDDHARRLHGFLLWTRNKLYAHTDKEARRSVAPNPNRPGEWEEGWQAIDRALMPEIIALCDEQGRRFYREAEELLAARALERREA